MLLYLTPNSNKLGQLLDVIVFWNVMLF